MVHATWGDWFVGNEVETDDVDGMAVWYLGCNAFVVRTPSTTAYVDPYFGDGDPPNIFRMIPVPMDPADATACDAVLVTHEHIDHFHPPSYGPLVEDLGAPLYAPSASFEEPDYEGDRRLPDDRQRVIEAGETFDVGDLTVHARGANDPDAIEPVSFVIEHGGRAFFHGGDSRPAEAFHDVGREFDLDLGTLAFGTVGNIYYPNDGRAERTRWYMDENEVIEAANALRLDRLLPSHFDMWRGVDGDPKVLHEHAASHEYPRVLEVVQVGDRVDLDRPGVVRPAALE